jgi:hypothetical protein
LEHGLELSISTAGRAASPVTGDDGQETSIDVPKWFLIIPWIPIRHLSIKENQEKLRVLKFLVFSADFKMALGAGSVR